jgi:hypothetical protein
VLISAASSEILPRRRLVPPADAPLDAAGQPRQYTALRPGRLCHFPVIGPPSATATAPAVPLAGRLACVRAKIAEVVTVSVAISSADASSKHTLSAWVGCHPVRSITGPRALKPDRLRAAIRSLQKRGLSS